MPRKIPYFIGVNPRPCPWLCPSHLSDKALIEAVDMLSKSEYNESEFGTSLAHSGNAKQKKLKKC